MSISDEVLRIATDSRAALRKMTDAQVVELTRAWVQAWDALEAEFKISLDEIMEMEDDGVILRSKVVKHVRLKAALDQAELALDGLAREMSDKVVADIATIVDDAVAAQIAGGNAQLPPVSVGVSFDRLPLAATDAIVARTAERIHAVSKNLSPSAIKAMKSHLIRGMVVGENPRRVAYRILKSTEGAFNGGLTRAVAITRTEMLDAHRQATRSSAKHNQDLLSGWVWHAQFDTRTCGSCLANHGTEHPIDEFGPIDHVQGRCARIDVTKSWKELGFDVDIPEPPSVVKDAEEWFNGLDPQSRVDILGATRVGLLDDGKIKWNDLTTKVTNPDWRSSMQNTPVRDLLAK